MTSDDASSGDSPVQRGTWKGAPGRPVRLVLNGEAHECVAAPETMLLDWLRGERRLTGTKEGCAEGDCGACTIVLARRDGDGRVRVEPCNACIRPLASVDGMGVLTVEGLGGAHPAQRALVERHGSQCGFCTPGFVMAIAARCAAVPRLGPLNGRAAVDEALAGNLCRCTGYRPIVDAALQATAALPANAAEVLPGLPGWLAALPPPDPQPLGFACDGARFDAPRSADEVDAMLAETPDAWLLAGGTDIGLWVTKALRRPRRWIWLGAVEGLARVRADERGIDIGAAVPLADAFAVLHGDYPELDGYWSRFASPSIRASGTLVGNLANGSPIGDATPVLMALDATVVLRRRGGRRELPLEALYVDYKVQRRDPDEWIERVIVPRRREAQRVAAFKLSKRREQDISAVSLAISFDRRDSTLAQVRAAYGGMAATVRRAPRVEAALEGAADRLESFERAAAALAADFTPLSDMRAGAGYRLDAGAGLLIRAYHRLCGTIGAPASIDEVDA